jgi:cytochrome c oxidase assembly protein subunit 11
MSAGARRGENRRMRVRLSVVAVAMKGGGYGRGPVCDACGWGVGGEELAEGDVRPANTQVDASRTVTVELDANAHDLPWRFRPLVRHVRVHPGELATVEYEIVNVRGAPVTGQAVASYGPPHAAAHFRKIECFCFTQQTLAAGETRRMPVAFVVDPKLPRDVSTITLSYTFFEVAGRGGKS